MRNGEVKKTQKVAIERLEPGIAPSILWSVAPRPL